jgi:hypothetical protein
MVNPQTRTQILTGQNKVRPRQDSIRTSLFDRQTGLQPCHGRNGADSPATVSDPTYVRKIVACQLSISDFARRHIHHMVDMMVDSYGADSVESRFRGRSGVSSRASLEDCAA